MEISNQQPSCMPLGHLESAAYLPLLFLILKKCDLWLPCCSALPAPTSTPQRFPRTAQQSEISFAGEKPVEWVVVVVWGDV
jgi:hypothetical protein